MANDTHEVAVSLLDSRPVTSSENSAPIADCPSVQAGQQSRRQQMTAMCVTCGNPCVRSQWLVPKFLGGGFACRREHVGARR